MKVGILTFHDGLNHGAYLQAFAIMNFMKNMGYDTEIINYKNKTHRSIEDIQPWFKYRRPIRFIDRINKQMAFSKDHKKMNLSSYTNDIDKVKQIKYDLVIIGSDVVWNYKVFGYDDLYFGGVNADRIISYAASFGWVNADEKIPEAVKKGLQRFDAISVRDDNSRKIVKQLCNTDAPIVLDPTFIYNLNKKAHPSKYLTKPGLLVYAHPIPQRAINIVKKHAHRENLELVATGYRNAWCDKNLMGVGPLEWLTLFQRASMILTTTFHGTVFSIINKKPFYYVVNVKAHNRVVSLLETCGIDISILDAEEGTLLYFDPDYDSIDEKLQEATRQSRNWLVSNINK